MITTNSELYALLVIYLFISSTQYLTCEILSGPLEDKIHIHVRACDIHYVSHILPWFGASGHIFVKAILNPNTTLLMMLPFLWILLQLTIDIGQEVRYQNKMLNEMVITFINDVL